MRMSVSERKKEKRNDEIVIGVNSFKVFLPSFLVQGP